MKKKYLLPILLIIIILSCALSACNDKDKVVSWNGEDIEYFAHIRMTIDERNMEEYVGSVDYVFSGTVSEIKSNLITYPYKDDFSEYEIEVDDNIKGELVDKVIAKKHGGINEDGVMLLYYSDNRKDTALPEEGKKYIFMAYAQPNGDLILSEFFDNREYSQDLLKEYEEYYANEVGMGREKSTSKYDINY